MTNERYTAYLMGVNASLKVTRQSIGGFLAKTAGTITVVNDKGATIVDAVPVAAGLYYPLPFLLQSVDGHCALTSLFYFTGKDDALCTK